MKLGSGCLTYLEVHGRGVLVGAELGIERFKVLLR